MDVWQPRETFRFVTIIIFICLGRKSQIFLSSLVNLKALNIFNREARVELVSFLNIQAWALFWNYLNLSPGSVPTCSRWAARDATTRVFCLRFRYGSLKSRSPTCPCRRSTGCRSLQKSLWISRWVLAKFIAERESIGEFSAKSVFTTSWFLAR